MRPPEEHDEQSIKQYTTELQEVIPRMEDQKFILSNGIILTTKSVFTDFINILNCLARERRKTKIEITDIRQSIDRLKLNLKDKDEELTAKRDELFVSENREKILLEEGNKKSEQIESITREINELKKIRITDQKRTIQREKK